MKKFKFLLTILLLLTISSCGPKEITGDDIFDYSDFEDITLYTHNDAESKSDAKYVVYYFQELCSHCQEVKQEILGFANEFSALDFYIIDASKTPDQTSLPEFIGTPTVFVFSGNQIIEQYIGITKVRTFIETYGNLELTYESFSLQQLNNYSEVEDIVNDTYLLYLYSDDCTDCEVLENDLFAWAFPRNIDDILFLNATSIINPDDLPPGYDSFVPLLLVMSDGEPTNEYYLGSLNILNYLQLIGDGDIISQN